MVGERTWEEGLPITANHSDKAAKSTNTTNSATIAACHNADPKDSIAFAEAGQPSRHETTDEAIKSADTNETLATNSSAADATTNSVTDNLSRTWHPTTNTDARFNNCSRSTNSASYGFAACTYTSHAR